MDQLLIVAGLLWLVAPVVLLFALLNARGHLRRLRRTLAAGRSPGEAGIWSRSGDSRRLAPVDLEGLVLLRLELKGLALTGALPAARCEALLDALDGLWSDHLAATWPESDHWMRQRDRAWETLVAWSEVPPGPPPWQRDDRDAGFDIELPDLDLYPDLILPDQGLGEADTPATDPTAPPSTPNEPPAWPEPPATASHPAPGTLTPQPAPARPAEPAPASLWRTTEPSRWEVALRQLSGWPRLIAPFLVQNIGWFIGGFCLVAGVLFLIANTAGLLNALLVFASLLATNALLLWGGYQLQRRLPALRVASAVLLTLASLLGPLVLAVAVRLIAAGLGADQGFGLAAALGVLAASVALGAFAFTAHLGSALLDRSLQGHYAWLLTGLAAVQLAVPVAAVAPGWWPLAVLHGLLLMLLGYGLRAFTARWLRRLFLDRQMTTWYAAGMLVYTALVSFVHLTWVWPAPLPVGYYGVFLMALCTLLLPVDAAFKEWVGTQAWLSRFTFALYALSVTAIAVAVQGRLTALATLTLGVGLYGWMTWRYRTWPPLYLMLGCVAGLYGYLVLAWLPPIWHALASQPGLLGLLALGRVAGRVTAPVGRQCLVAFALLLLGLTAWSLAWTLPWTLPWHPSGGLAGCATLAAAAVLVAIAVRVGLALPEADPSWACGDAVVIALALGALAWWPDWPATGWATRTAAGSLALAVLWLWLALQHRGQRPVSRTLFALGGLISIGLALGLGVLGLIAEPARRPEPVLLFGIASPLLLWLALGLRRRWLFYGFLASVGVAGVLAKLAWFPRPGSGALLLLLALTLWALLWRLALRERLRRALLGEPLAAGAGSGRPDDVTRSPAIAFPGAPAANLFEVVRPALEQAMVLLWTLGLMQLGVTALAGARSLSLPWIAGLAAGVGLMLVGHFRWYAGVAVPMLLLIAGLSAELALLGMPPPWLGAAVVLAALLLWQFGALLLARSETARLAQALGFMQPGVGGRQRAEAGLRNCAIGIAWVPVLTTPAVVLAARPVVDLLPAVAAALVLFLRLVRQEPTPGRVWPVLATLSVGAWGIAHWLHPALFALGQPWLNGFGALALAVAAQRVSIVPGGHLAHWDRPLRWVSGLLYLLALAGVTPLLASCDPGLPALAGVAPLLASGDPVLPALAGVAPPLASCDPGLPALLVLLIIGLFPVVRPLPEAAALRGLGLLPLAGALCWTLGQGRLDPPGWVGLLAGGGYGLWILANLGLPRWNARWPCWATDPTTWPLVGLMLVAGAMVAGVMIGTVSPAVALAVLTPYLFLLLANTAWPGLGWIAVVALAASGLLAIRDLHWRWSGGLYPTLMDGLLTMLLWSNLLFLLVSVWRRHGSALARWLHWRQPGLAGPLFQIPFWLLVASLAVLLLVEGVALLGMASMGLGRPAGLLLTGAVLVVTALHGWRLQPGPVTAQMLLAALTALLPALLLVLGWTVGLPFLLALWAGLLLLAWRFMPGRLESWRAELSPWLLVLPLGSLGLLVPLAPGHPGIAVATLALLTLLTLARGWWQVSAPAIRGGLVLLLLTGDGLWLIHDPDLARLPGLLPWYALQTALLLAGLLAVRRRLNRLPVSAAGPDRAGVIAPALEDLAWFALALTLVALGLHVLGVLLPGAGWPAPAWQVGPVADPLAAGGTLLLLAELAALRAWREPDQRRLAYIALLLLGLLALYGRLMLWGLAPITPWDTGVLFTVAAIAFLLHQALSWPGLYRLALWLPALAVVTVPWQLASVWTGSALLAAALLYLSQAGRLRNPWPLYLGVLALTAMVYLWAPLWAARFGLWQFYIVPAAVSVLVLLQLHRHELRPAVLSSARLAALCALYTGAGLDLFLRPGLGVFVLALALALAGILLGIALRIRVFLYAGVAFLIVNVLGQLVRFYPEQGLARAMILIGLGVVITAGMVTFNLQREAILRRVRITRADLAGWA